jgi:hypothetical protein
MVTALDKELKRQVQVDGSAYTVALDADGLRITGKGKRKPEVALRWKDLLSGDAAMATALNASLVLRSDKGLRAARGNDIPVDRRPKRRR